MGNDITIITSLTTFFILLALILPVINSAFDTEYDGVGSDDVDELTDDVNSNADGNELTIFRVILSLISVWFWSFGELPLIANLLLLVPRIIFIITIARNVWIGGGS